MRVCGYVGGCEWSSITVVPGLLWGSGTWARYPGEDDGMGMGDASLISLSFLHPGQRGTHLAGQGTPSPGQPPPLSDPLAGLPSASCFPFPSLCFLSSETWLEGQGLRGGSVYFSRCLFLDVFAGGQNPSRSAWPDMEGREAGAGRKTTIFSPLSRMHSAGLSLLPLALHVGLECREPLGSALGGFPSPPCASQRSSLVAGGPQQPLPALSPSPD